MVNKVIFLNVCFGLLMVFLFLRHHAGNPRKEENITMHVLISNEEKFIYYSSEQ